MAAEEAVGREDLETRVGGRDQDDHHAGALRSALLGRIGEGGLVAVVTVRDQELPVCECLGDAVARQRATAPSPRRRDPPRRRERGPVARRRRGGRSARAVPAPSAGAAACSPSARRAFARAGARCPSRTARRAARRRRPRGFARRRRGRRSAAGRPRPRARPQLEDAVREPGSEQPAGFLLRVAEGQPNDVVRVAGPVLVPQRRCQHVVWRRREPVGREYRIARKGATSATGREYRRPRVARDPRGVTVDRGAARRLGTTGAAAGRL